MPTRRTLLKCSVAFGLSEFGAVGSAFAESSTGATHMDWPGLIKPPLLANGLYKHKVSDQYDAQGRAGVNRSGFQYIEEQRQGAEWVVRGAATGQAEWKALGWKILDWGLRQQKRDGSFGSRDPFHSTSLFLESLGRALLVDKSAADERRLSGLARGLDWQRDTGASKSALLHNLPYTHRRYILAAAFGHGGRLTGNREFAATAAGWARDGLSLQRDDGENPEAGGFDASYQMVGALMALRYMVALDDDKLLSALKAMLRKAVARELRDMAPDGNISMAGSSRIGRETTRAGVVKQVSYGEVVQALVMGAQLLPESKWLDPAERIVRRQRW